jgi:hypothetical protein
MKEIYNVEKYSVMIECDGESGSGIFVSSKSPEYDYVVTAKHCLDNYKIKSDIIFPNNNFTVIEVYKNDTLDTAIIRIEKSTEVSLFSFIEDDDLENYNESIYLYGYPKIARNKEIKSAKLNCKYDNKTENLIRLEVEKEVSTFKKAAIELLQGMSGCPVYIEKDNVVILVGIYYENTYEDFSFRYINIIPLEKIRDTIMYYKLEDLNLSFRSELISEDLDPLYKNYEELSTDDYRNLKDKIRAVSPSYNKMKIDLLSRKLANTACEIERLSYKRKMALLYRVFMSSNEKQCELVLENKKILNENEVNEWLDKFTDYSKEIIDQKSEDYKYPLKSKDIINGVVLQLIDNCYISLDEKGYYYEEGDDD